MRRVKVVMRASSQGGVLLGLDAKLLDADTGEELDCTDLRLDFPLKGIVTANATFHVAEIELQ